MKVLIRNVRTTFARFMKRYITFLRHFPEQAFFGWMLNFFSSFGQTFLISLFVPFVLSDLGLSKTVFGGLYAGATVIASMLLLRFGHIIDERPVRPFTYKSIGLLIISCGLFAAVIHPAMLFIALLGLRLAGQGLMSHISMSIMSRYFQRDRGKALSISSLGFSVGEMIFPLLFGSLTIWIGWRWSAGLATVILAFALLILHFMNLEEMDEKKLTEDLDKVPEKKIGHFAKIMKEKEFWIIAPPVFVMSFVVTGFFFFQYIMAEDKGWPPETYSLFFAGYGGVRLFFSLYGGILIDKFSAVKLFPFYLIPMILGVLSIGLMNGLWSAGAFLFLTGITVGCGGNIKAAIIAEVYGVERIGRVRSLFTVVMVISTAAAPLLFGLFLDSEAGFEKIAFICAGLMILVAAHNFRIYAVRFADSKP